MKYIRVSWTHQDAQDPVLLYSELDSQRWEVRKIEIFRDGSVGYASAGSSSGDTKLGIVPVPELHVIAAEREFSPCEITKEEFEVLWRDRRSAT
jgi:hypothetical protein